MASILRENGLSKLIGDPALVLLADGFEFTEGPLWCPDGSILFQDIKAERTYQVVPGDRPEIVREHTGAANGQTYMKGGRIVFCEQNGRRVSSMDQNGGDVRTLAEYWEGKRLNSPNDIVSRSDGVLIFTDPPYGVQPADREISFQGVHAILGADGPSPSLKLLADDFEKPNGLAFSPDEKILYVCDTGRYHVRAFDVTSDGEISLESSRVFATLDPDQPGGPDGMKVDRDGRVYVAVAQGIWVFEPSGTLLGIIATPKRPANLAWTGRDGRGLAMTIVDAVYHVALPVSGIVPPFLP
jgi:gluconolactonase